MECGSFASRKMDIHYAFGQMNEGRRHQNQSGHDVIFYL
jgi:hypothetical protein